MLKGNIIGGSVVLSEDGKPIVETSAPTPPDGYEMLPTWRDDGTRIVQTWEAVPVAGSVDDAVRTLAMMQAETLSDDDALKVVPLYKEWVPGLDYKTGDRRTWGGDLFRCLQDHTALADWNPADAPSLWAKVLPGQEGNEPEEGFAEWEQPGSTNPYGKGDKVTHGGHLWESTSDWNVWEPGAVGAPWTDLGVYPPEA